MFSVSLLVPHGAFVPPCFLPFGRELTALSNSQPIIPPDPGKSRKEIPSTAVWQSISPAEKFWQHLSLNYIFILFCGCVGSVWLQRVGCSLQWLLLLQSMGFRALWLQQLGLMGLVALGHRGSSQTRDRTRVPCIGRWILNHWTSREALYSIIFILAFFSFWVAGLLFVSTMDVYHSGTLFLGFSAWKVLTLCSRARQQALLLRSFLPPLWDRTGAGPCLWALATSLSC